MRSILHVGLEDLEENLLASDKLLRKDFQLIVTQFSVYCEFFHSLQVFLLEILFEEHFVNFNLVTSMSNLEMSRKEV
tara:strand:- start:550 stop:780 length:231 start_codon:yes stop_codon:yes gene_type:complete